MTLSIFIGFVVIVLVALSLIGMAIPLLLGKGTWLIAGYNTMNQEEKTNWDGPALARFVGKILLAIGLVTLPYGVGVFYFSLQWLTWPYLAFTVGLSVFAVIYCNTGNRFRK